MLILDHRATLDRMVHMSDRRWQITLGPQKRMYVVHSDTQMGALGAALHQYSRDTDTNLGVVKEFHGVEIAQVERETHEIGGAPV